MKKALWIIVGVVIGAILSTTFLFGLSEHYAAADLGTSPGAVSVQTGEGR